MLYRQTGVLPTSSPKCRGFHTSHTLPHGTPLKISDVVDHYFTRIGPRLGNNIPATDASFTEYITPTQHSFSVKETNNSAVHKLIQSLPLNNGSGLDGISCRLLKEAAPIITPLLTFIINLSISSGIFPDDWKIARVSPAYKENVNLYQFCRSLVK